MLLTAAFDDLEKVGLRQAVGSFKNRRGNLGVLVKCKFADRLEGRLFQCGQGVAERDHGCRVHPPDQMGEHAIDCTYLGFAEVIDIGQEQVRHLLEYSGVVLGRSVQFSGLLGRYGSHGFICSVWLHARSATLRNAFTSEPGFPSMPPLRTTSLICSTK